MLLALAKHGSMARAANNLAISQPAVSRAIAELEKSLGVRLLDRGRRGVMLTTYGQALVRRASIVVDELKQGLREIDFLANSAAGELYIGCPESHASWLLPPAIEQFCSNHPRVSVHVTPVSTIGRDFSPLRERQVDFVIGRVPKSIPANDLAIEKLFDEHFYVVASARSPWAQRRNIKLRDLVDCKWIMTPSANPTAEIISDAFAAHGLDVPRASVEAASINLRMKLLLSGQFVAMLPNGLLYSMGPEIKALKVLPVDLTALSSPVAVLTLKNRTPTPALAPFLAFLRSVAKPLALHPNCWMQ